MGWRCSSGGRIGGHRVDIVGGRVPRAFCAGILRPAHLRRSVGGRLPGTGRAARGGRARKPVTPGAETLLRLRGRAARPPTASGSSLPPRRIATRQSALGDSRGGSAPRRRRWARRAALAAALMRISEPSTRAKPRSAQRPAPLRQPSPAVLVRRGVSRSGGARRGCAIGADAPPRATPRSRSSCCRCWGCRRCLRCAPHRRFDNPSSPRPSCVVDSATAGNRPLRHTTAARVAGRPVRAARARSADRRSGAFAA